MLILKRRLGERVLIGDDIWLTVTEIHGNRVALGIEAPREIQIQRFDRAGPGSQDSAVLFHSEEMMAERHRTVMQRAIRNEIDGKNGRYIIDRKSLLKFKKWIDDGDVSLEDFEWVGGRSLAEVVYAMFEAKEGKKPWD